MIRRVLYWPAVLLWSAVLLPVATLAGVLTLGLLSHHLIEVFARLWGRGMLWISGVRLEVRGREHLTPPRSRILVLNHSSFLDMQVVAALSPPGALGLAKKEFKLVPLLGLALWALGQVFVDRGSPANARRSLDRLGRELRRRPRTVIIFPEGTRSRTGELQPFKLGAFRLAAETRTPILPAVLHGAYALQRPSDPVPRPGKLVLELYPEISTEGWTDADLHVEAERLRAWYAERLVRGPAY